MSPHKETGAARPRVSGLAGGVVVGLLALSTTLSAQTTPLPALPEEPAAAEPADAANPNPDQLAEVVPDTPGAVAAKRPRAWEYGLGVGAGYNSNINFLVPNGPSSLAISPLGNLARVFWGQKGQLRLSGAGYWVGYPDQRDLSNYNATFSVDGTYRSGRNTTWRVNGSYGLSYSDSSVVLAAQGVLLPLVKTRTLAAALGATWQLASKTSFHLDGRIYRTVFDQKSTEAPELTDGQSIRGSTGIAWNLGLRNTVGLEYALESTLGRAPQGAADQQGSYYLTQYGSLQWTRLFSRRSALLLEAGASYTPNNQEAGLGQQTSFYGGASFSRQVKTSTITLFARREVAPAFGIGLSRLENRLGLNTSVPLGQAWWLRLTAMHVMPETPSGAPVSYAVPDEAFLSLGRRMGRMFVISADGRYRRRGSTITTPAVEGFQAGLFLSLFSPTERSRVPLVGR